MASTGEKAARGTPPDSGSTPDCSTTADDNEISVLYEELEDLKDEVARLKELLAVRAMRSTC